MPKHLSTPPTAFYASFIIVTALAFGMAGYGAKILPSQLVLLAGVLAGTLPLLLASRFPLPRTTVCLMIPGALSLIYTLAQLLPLSQLPPLLAYANPLWPSAQALLGTTHPTLSLDAGAGVMPFLTALATGVAFLAATSLGLLGRGKFLLKSLAVVISALSVYGLIIFAMGNESVLFAAKTAYKDSLSATYVNRNTFATVAGLGVLLALYGFALTLPNLPSAGRANFRQRLRLFLHITLFPGWPWLVMAGLNLLALVLTLSRGGLAASIIALAIWWLVVFAKARGGRPFWALCGGVVLLVAALLLPIASHNFNTRLLETGRSADVRESINEVSLAAHAANPWLGYGPGTYNSVYRMYDFSKPDKGWAARMVHAHNSWLETLVESGRPAALLWLASIAAILVGLARQARLRRTGYPAPTVALGAALLVGLHAWVDFSPHNPTVAILLALILGAGWGQGAATPNSQPAASKLPLRAGLATVILATLGFMAWQSPAWLQTYQLEHTLTPRTANLHYGQAQKLARTHPSAATHRLAANVGLLSAAGLPQLQSILRTEALRHTTAALSYAPADPYLWHQRAQLQNHLRQPQAAAQSLVYSYLTGPSENNLAMPRYTLTTQLWPLLSQENKDALQPHLQRLTAAKPKRYPPLP